MSLPTLCARGAALLLFALAQAAALQAAARTSLLTLETKTPGAAYTLTRWDGPTGDNTYLDDTIACTRLDPRGATPFGVIKKSADAISLSSPAQVECKVTTQKLGKDDIFKIRLKDAKGNLLELGFTMGKSTLVLDQVKPLQANGSPRILTSDEKLNLEHNVIWSNAPANAITLNSPSFFEADPEAPTATRSRSGAVKH